MGSVDQAIASKMKTEEAPKRRLPAQFETDQNIALGDGAGHKSYVSLVGMGEGGKKLLANESVELIVGRDQALSSRGSNKMSSRLA